MGKLNFFIFLLILYFRAGKTSWIERLIHDSKLSSRPKIIRYHYPEQLNKSPVKWCEKFENIQVEYEQGIPKNADYWTNIEKNTLGSKLFFSIFTIFKLFWTIYGMRLVIVMKYQMHLKFMQENENILYL